MRKLTSIIRFFEEECEKTKDHDDFEADDRRTGSIGGGERHAQDILFLAHFFNFMIDHHLI